MTFSSNNILNYLFANRTRTGQKRQAKETMKTRREDGRWKSRERGYKSSKEKEIVEQKSTRITIKAGEDEEEYGKGKSRKRRYKRTRKRRN